MTAAATKPKNIYEIISAVRQEVGALRAERQAGSGVPFAFRGIDATVNHIVPALNKYGIVTVPTVLEHVVEHIESGNRLVTWAQVVVQYEFFAPDGTSVKAQTPGLAQDFADRATAQAMSVAFRIALLQTFTLPTDSPEPEVTGQEVLDAAAPATKVQKDIAKAAAAPTLDDLRRKVKIAGGKKNLSSAQLNEIGSKYGDDFIDKAESLEKILKDIDAL